MISHFTKMAVKAWLKFKLHSIISLLSLVFGFLCFISAILLSNYTQSFDQHFPNAERIFNINMKNTGADGGPDNFPVINEPAARYLRAAFPDIPNIVSGTAGGQGDVVVDGEALSLATRYVESRFFDIFPLETLHGIATGEQLPPNSVMITEAAAIRLFGRSDVVGERMLLNNRDDVVIAGVAAKSEFPSHLDSSVPFFSSDLFIPMAILDQSQRENRIAAGTDPDADQWGNQSYFVYIEIPEDMDFDADTFNQQLDQFVNTTLPEDRAENMTYELQPINKLVTSLTAIITGGFDIIRVLVVAGALVLLIGCLNYSNLVIAQLSLRSQEIGVQKILGSKRSLLVIQYCFESFLFVAFALLLTLLLFAVVLTQFAAAGFVGVGPGSLFDPQLLFALIIVMVVIVAIAGAYPAIRTTSVSLVSLMRPKGSSGYSGKMRSLMVGVQFFISGTLMVLAIIMFSQNSTMTQQLDGEVADPKIVVTTPLSTYTVDPELLISELKQHPGVISVSQTDRQPWEIGMGTNSLSRSGDINATTFEISNQSVGYEFTETMDLPLLAGRDFSRDRANDAPPPVNQLSSNSGPYSILLDDKATQTLGWENAAEALGESVFLHIGPPSIENEIAVEMIVIGRVGDLKTKFINFESFGVSGSSFTLGPTTSNFLLIKIGKKNVNEALTHIEDTWDRLMPGVSLKRIFADELFYQTYDLFLSISASIGVLSIIGFLIASIGLLGNATFITNIRQKEVGIRKVMGASSSRLLRMLLLDFAKPIFIANIFVWPLGYIVGIGYTGLFANQASVTLFPFLVSLFLSVLIAVIAVISQSWKSAHVRPAMVLRYE